MNRFIAYARKSSSAPFLVSIYRDYQTFSGYGAVCYSARDRRTIQKPRQVTQEIVYSPTWKSS
ncbi:hypothetical protein H6F51_22255 [Cyanobacteria bacterium FACHB-DQ100]|nr:hypothetical protein [Cyanobacteria bacterium FACHB-DQ100]